jgi:3-deoxy-manno-octulosonate cytidylyltransferase (CMP-KDO synthetase)
MLIMNIKNNKILILIPARYQSSRFPGKPLKTILGKSVIQRVYENCSDKLYDNSLDITAVVVTDSDEIESHVKGFGGDVCRVDDLVESGSERIYLAYKRNFSSREFELIVNVQGDEPLITSTDISQLICFHLKSSFDIATMVKGSKSSNEELNNPNKVKVIYSPKTSRCLYFSRQAIPYFSKDDTNDLWYHHIGVYSYRPNKLEEFFNAERSYYEIKERLEQLRALEIGMTIGAVETEKTLIGVDTPEDIKKVEGAICDKTN